MNIKYIVVHSTATPTLVSDAQLKQSWRDNGEYPPFHYLVERNGEVSPLLRFKKQTKGKQPLHQEYIHIAYTGGIGKTGLPENTMSPLQEDALFDLLVLLSERYPDAVIVGQNELTEGADTSPGFSVKQWLSSYLPFLSYDENETDLAA